LQRYSAAAVEDAVWAALRHEGGCRMVLQIHDELLFEVGLYSLNSV
jgi:DNA polymerase I-like protein with 3'-5' exonuclease and polymerase domains